MEGMSLLRLRPSIDCCWQWDEDSAKLVISIVRMITTILGRFGAPSPGVVQNRHWTDAPITCVTNILAFDSVVAFEASVRDIVLVIVPNS
jgi:hypothetical protein